MFFSSKYSFYVYFVFGTLAENSDCVRGQDAAAAAAQAADGYRRGRGTADMPAASAFWP